MQFSSTVLWVLQVSPHTSQGPTSSVESRLLYPENSARLHSLPRGVSVPVVSLHVQLPCSHVELQLSCAAPDTRSALSMVLRATHSTDHQRITGAYLWDSTV